MDDRSTNDAPLPQDPAAPRPNAAKIRDALLEVVSRGGHLNAASFARDLHIDLSSQPSARTLSARRSRSIERAVLGVFAGFCLTAAAVLGFDASFEAPKAPAAAPAPRLAAAFEAAGIYGTGSLEAPALSFAPGGLSGAGLSALLARAPERCAPSGDGALRTVLGDRLTEAPPNAALSGGICLETTRYDLEHGVYTQRTALSGGGYLEINGAFSIEGDALCHMTAGATAHVLGGGVSPDYARRKIELVEARLASFGGQPLCHGFRTVDAANDIYIADIAIPGDISELSTSAPFTMRSE